MTFVTEVQPRCEVARPADAPLKRRAYHRKVRTGCVTCKIRRLRCDETKPSCTRCTSTGRKCDGYGTPEPATSTPSSSTTTRPNWPYNVPKTTILTASSPKPRADARLLLPRMDPREVRSYRYFLDVAAPSLSGFFDAEFWLVELPRVAHCDAAIWHAIVCLGAVHESEGGPTATGDRDTALFGVEQFNKTIQSLRSSLRKSDHGLALTISTIFTIMCFIGNRYEQAMIHLSAGVKMLRDLEGDDLKPITKATSDLERAPSSFASVPISIAPMRNIILRVNMAQRALTAGGLFGSMSSGEILENNIFKVWQSYKAPVLSTGPKSMLTPDIVLMANKASESLLNGLVYSSQEQSDVLDKLVAGEGDRESQIARLALRQRPLAKGYRELAKALALFETELRKPSCGSAKATRQQLTHAIRPLRLYLATCRIIMVLDPETQTPQKMSGHGALCSSILENAEAILSIDDTRLELESGTKVAFTSNAMAMDALFMCAHSSPNLAQRRRASDLMRRPKNEGVWPTLMASSLADAVIAREVEALAQYRRESAAETQQNLENGSESMKPAKDRQHEPEKKATETATDYEEADLPHGLHRVRSIILKLQNGRQALMTMQTWGESINKQPGRESLLTW